MDFFLSSSCIKTYAFFFFREAHFKYFNREFSPGGADMKMDVKVGQCMTVGVFTLPADKTVRDAARLLRKTNVGSVIITQKGKAKGIITERDIVYKVIALGKDPVKTKLKSVMSRPLKVIKASDKVESAAMALRNNRVKRLPASPGPRCVPSGAPCPAACRSPTKRCARYIRRRCRESRA